MLCELCMRDVKNVERHHLYPKPKKDNTKTILVCPVCHDQIHSYFTNKKLIKKINTKEKLQEEMIGFIDWIKTKPDVHFPIQRRKNDFR